MPVEEIYNGDLTYQPHRFARGRNSSRCHVEILQNGKDTLVIATELQSNPGQSITNSSEHLATEIVARFVLDPTHTTFVEHYNAKISYGTSYLAARGPGVRDVYSIVTYTWKDDKRIAFDPQWQHFKEAEFLALKAQWDTREEVRGK